MTATTTRTYYYDGDTIELSKAGKIVAASNAYFAAGPHFRIGSKVKVETLRNFGYRPVKAPAQYDAWGRKI